MPGIIATAREHRAKALLGPHPGDPALVEMFGGLDGGSSGVDVTPTTAMQQSAVLACVRIISETLASTPLFVNRREPDGSKAPDPAHRLYSVLHDKPNRWQTKFEFIDYLVHALLLRGFSAAEIFPGPDGYPYGELVPLHPDRVTPFRAPDGSRAFQYRPPTGPARIILQEEMLYVPFLPDDGYKAVSIIKHAADVIGTGIQAQRLTARLFGRNLRPGGILKYAGKLTPEQKAELRASWEDRHQGPKNAGRLALMEQGMEFEAISISPEDAQLLEHLKYSAADIARIFLVQQHKIGIMEASTFSNIEHQAIEWVTGTIRPHAVRYEQAFARDLFTPDGRKTHFVEFELEGLLRGDIVSRYNAFAVGKQWGWLNTNTILKKENMNTIGPEGDVYLMPMNMAVMSADGLSLAQRVTAVAELVKAGYEPAAAAAEVGLSPIAHTGLVPITVKPEGGPPMQVGPTPAQQRQLRDALPGLRIGRARIEASYSGLFEDAARRLVHRDMGELRKATSRGRSEGELNAWLRSFEVDERAAVSRMLTPVVRSLMEAIAWEAILEARGAIAPDIGAFAEAYVASMAERISRAAVASLQSGDLAGVVRTWEHERAGAIAARELTQASNAAALEGFRQVGVARVCWVGRGDTSADCVELITRDVAIGETFVEGRKVTHPPLRDGCTCTIEAMIE